MFNLQNYLQTQNPNVELKPFTFTKILSRTATIILFFSLIWFRKKIDKKSISSLGLEQFGKRRNELLIGFLVGIISLSLVVTTKVIFGVSTWAPKEFTNNDWFFSAYFLLVVFFIGFVEELFFQRVSFTILCFRMGRKKSCHHHQFIFFTHTFHSSHHGLIRIIT
ncbi:hypothetical protein LEP1GSC202_2619 [Leptospira yanagawae serovar Saopaulo str. Sao Paulo = ATCC 700523]|uniref:Uncharacterized protein n=1 Tax=Leptospira yanagawae serovar Saopaulo str. Sao Paulo = ATCC 700523 TaxID=1249483 RepID=A0A5E8H7K8_9LEPT|nr:hypothetical protein LEP1GSC202_2619 [Leptospira yanagawae serovar Saopaulo str. Sao Paulo = ATCC 700523]